MADGASKGPIASQAQGCPSISRATVLDLTSARENNGHRIMVAENGGVEKTEV